MRKSQYSLSIFLAVLSLIITIIVLADAISGRSFLFGIDSLISSYMDSVNSSSEGIVSVFKFITEIGGTEIMSVLGVLAAFIFLFRKKWRESAKIFSAIVSTAIVTLILKELFMRERPSSALEVIVNDPSFPSGHAAMAAAFFVTLGYVLVMNMKKSYSRIATVSIFAMLVFLIGLSRLVLNVHWFTDVVAGWSLGILLSMISILIVRRVFDKLKSKI